MKKEIENTHGEVKQGQQESQTQNTPHHESHEGEYHPIEHPQDHERDDDLPKAESDAEHFPASDRQSLSLPPPEYTSPSKSIKNFFRNRTSAYSFESISEEPELARTRPKKNSLISIGSELSPTRSPAKSISGGFNSLLQLKFGRSRTSLHSSASTAHDPVAGGSSIPIPIPTDKPTTIDDFADTSSSESSKAEYDSESINSILDEYERESRHASVQVQPNIAAANFVFREEFDETDSTRNTSKADKHSSIRTVDSAASAAPSGATSANLISVAQIAPTLQASSLNRDHPSIDVALSNAYVEPSPASAKRVSGSSNDSSQYTSGPSSATSAKFRVVQDRIEPVARATDSRKASDRRKVISASSNVDVNRSSLYNMTVGGTDSEPELRYPEPDVTPNQTPLTKNAPVRISDPDPLGPSTARLSDPIGSTESSQLYHSVEETALEPGYRSSLINPDETELPQQHGSDLNIDSSKNTTTSSQRNTVRSSLSSGELLNTLETYYDKKHPATSGVNQLASRSFVPQASSTLRFSQDFPKSGVANLTAGVDSTNELPVMLYKVQDRDYDEGNQRWSVYEHNRGEHQAQQSRVKASDSSDSDYRDPEQDTSDRTSSTGPQQPKRVYLSGGKSESAQTFKSAFSQLPLTTSKLPNHPIPSIPPLPRSDSGTISNKDYIEQNFNEHIGDFRRDRPRSISHKHSATSLGPPAPPSVPSPAVVRNTDRDHIFAGNEDGGTTVHTSENSYLEDIEKQIQGIQRTSPTGTNTPQHSFYSIGYFIAMMVLGLVVPPIYFLIALGVFDSTNTTQQYYLGLTQRSNVVKRYSKTQKLLSLVFGVVWFAVVLGMIGLGLGLGLTREK